MYIPNKKGVITLSLTLIVGIGILLGAVVPTTVRAVVTISEGGPILYTWPIPCTSPPGFWTEKLSGPLTIPVIYPYPPVPL